MSQHESIRTFIEDTVKSLRDDITFSYSRQSDFNSLSDKNDVCVHLDPLEWMPVIVDNSMHKQWTVGMFIFKQGSPDDTEEQFVPLLDETAELAEEFLVRINRTDDEDPTEPIRTDVIQITNPSAKPAIKVLSNCLTGWLLNFTIVAPDNFEYCTVYDS